MDGTYGTYVDDECFDIHDDDDDTDHDTDDDARRTLRLIMLYSDYKLCSPGYLT